MALCLADSIDPLLIHLYVFKVNGAISRSILIIHRRISSAMPRSVSNMRILDVMPQELELSYCLYSLFSSEHLSGLGRPFEWESNYRVHERES